LIHGNGRVEATGIVMVDFCRSALVASRQDRRFQFLTSDSVEFLFHLERSRALCLELKDPRHREWRKIYAC
jgi:hypothetical protein